jgi:chromosome segregation ATPase
LKDSDKTVRDL